MSISSTGTVPFLDLGRSFDDIRDDVLADVADALERSAFVNGPAVLEFEAAFARAGATEHCIGM